MQRLKVRLKTSQPAVGLGAEQKELACLVGGELQTYPLLCKPGTELAGSSELESGRPSIHPLIG
jgi:hypothetical protein